MDEWEYRTISCELSELDETLSVYGREHWEAWHLRIVSDKRTPCHAWVFLKRKMVSQESQRQR